MKFNIFRLVVIILVLYCSSGFSQDKKPISGNFKDLTIEQFAKQLEAQTGYKIYYDQSQFDSLRVNLDVNNKPISDVFSELFKNTNYSFAIDRNNRVYLTRGRRINTELPAGLFASRSQGAIIETQITDLGTTNEAGPVIATTENKLYEVGIRTSSLTGTATLSGDLRDAKTGEALVGAAIYVDNPRIGTTSDQFGSYNLTLPKGAHTLNIKAMGIKDTKRRIMLYSNGKLNFDVQPEITSLREVIISADKVANIKDVQMGVERISIATIKQVPAVFGEADVLKVVLTLPGVKSVGEASTGFNVRGGATDQNLILFNDATIYNPTHFFGLFSAFNPEVVKNVELYKSSIPARFGGRLSSVLDVNGRDGNMKKITGTAGLGLITSRINVEGPIVEDKSSFILGGRTTYSNWLMKLLPDDASYKDSKVSFYDLNLMLTNKVNDKNDLYFTGYMSSDASNLNTDTLFGYKNANFSIKWKHAFNDKLVAVATTGLDKYSYNNHTQNSSVNAYDLDFGIQQLNGKLDFNYFLNSRYTIDLGFNTIRYIVDPGNFQPRGSESLVMPDLLEREQAQESALYLGNRFDITPAFSVDFGVRYSMFNYLGPKKVNQYAPNVTRDPTSITGTTSYAKGDLIKTYHGPEARLSARYALTEDFSVKAGYNTLRQYIHMLSSTTAIAPTDIWKLSDPNIKPQYGDQVSFGLYKNFKANTIETSAEVYYKQLKDYLDYKSGSKIVMNHDIENAVFNTEGKAYGLELMIKKLTGKFNGWLSYTYSRTLLKQDDPNAGEVVNNGDYYPSNYDKPHDVTLISNFRISHRISFSFNSTYSTGRPVTVPIGKYFYSGSFRALYSDRNAYRVPDYFRMDLSLNVDGNHRVSQTTHNFWTFGVYNLTGRKNAYSTYFISEKTEIKGYKLSVFGSAIPFVNYNIKF
ncbi:TonB-dependent receptor [Daejeonella lutea]|uniref:Secretin and TonB N terminus short domain-containing protein n=1 Tax=Daejeonella lutea TaxID=572036 RepID=A0A1T5BH48_9SPHI|nr:TonB-dependent receptor [Daejeonella lutea]SKB46604.1 Secretin and TonB N terminus short domain-containing protein [Daejeonella lutea]